MKIEAFKLERWLLEKSEIEFSDMFTPNTVKRYTEHVNGTVYGTPDKVKDGRTNVNNLFICEIVIQ